MYSPALAGGEGAACQGEREWTFALAEHSKNEPTDSGERRTPVKARSPSRLASNGGANSSSTAKLSRLSRVPYAELAIDTSAKSCCIASCHTTCMLLFEGRPRPPTRGGPWCSSSSFRAIGWHATGRVSYGKATSMTMSSERRRICALPSLYHREPGSKGPRGEMG